MKRLLLIFGAVAIYGFLLSACSWSAFRYNEKLNSEEAIYRFGERMRYNAHYVTASELADLKKDLKSMLAFANPPNVKEEWQRISDLSLSDGLYVLFEMEPETALPPLFTNFKFSFNEREPLWIDSYFIVERLRSSTGVSMGAAFYGPMFFHGGHIFYPSTTGYLQSYQDERGYAYRYLLLFPKEMHNSGDNLFVVEMPEVGRILFRAP